MATVDAWNLPGADGDYIALPAGLGHFRTDTGYGAYTVAVVGFLDTLAAAERQILFASKRQSNDNLNHSIVIESANDNFEYQYQASTYFETSSSSEATGVWVLWALTYAGNGGNLTLRRIPLSTAVQSHSATGAPGGSNFDDAQTQDITLGGVEAGGVISGELDGRFAIVLILKGVELSQADLEDFASDPLNFGDGLVQTYGANCFFWDDTGVDIGPNDLGAPTLNGGVTRGSGNGPTVPDRAALGTAPSVNAVGNFGIQYYWEQHVVVNGTNFGTSEPIVVVNQDPLTNTGTPLDVYSFSDTQLIVNMPASGNIGASQLWVENRTAGPSFGLKDSKGIEMRGDPGSNVIAIRTGIPSVNMQSGVAISLQTKPHFYHRGAQEVLAYSKASGNFPTGLSMSNGVISGTIDSGAASGSPYNAVIRATDMNGDFAEQALNWTVTGVVATAASAGSWGRRKAR